MPRSLDIETVLEDSFLSLLPTYLGAGVTVKRWDDIKEKDLTPVVKIKANLVNSEDGTMNLYCAERVLVDFGCFTSRRDDENGKVSNGIRGDIRELLNQDNIDTLLNGIGGLAVYNRGIIPQDSSDISDDKVFGKSLSVLVIARTV